MGFPVSSEETAADSMKYCLSSPCDWVRAFIMNSAIGERQMFPWQTKISLVIHFNKASAKIVFFASWGKLCKFARFCKNILIYIMKLKIVVLAKQVPDTRNVGKDAMTAEGTVNRAALPAIFNPDDLIALEQALRLKEQTPGSSV